MCNLSVIPPRNRLHVQLAAPAGAPGAPQAQCLPIWGTWQGWSTHVAMEAIGKP